MQAFGFVSIHCGWKPSGFLPFFSSRGVETMTEQKTLFIDPNADVSGIRPADLTEPLVIEITDTDPVVTVEERQAKSGGKFDQYTLNLKDRRVSYLFQRDLAPLAKEWGGDPSEWKGKKVSITAEADGEFMRVVVKPLETTVAA